MKRSKTIKLVLVTGLLGSRFAGKAHNSTTASADAYHLKNFSGDVFLRNGYTADQDSAKRAIHFAAFFRACSRGGFGFFGHHSMGG